jgi:polyhydroxyalkanoate synthesis regulator phasin
MAEWTGDVDDDNQASEEDRVVRKAVMRLVKDGSKADTAQAVVSELLESLTASSGDEAEDGVVVQTFDDGEHYYVMLTFKGQTGALEPDEARAVAEDLLKAANEAESKQQ